MRLRALVLALALLAPAGGGRPHFQDQVGAWVIPFAVVQRAAAAWGVSVTYGGPPGCHTAGVICMDTLPASWPGLPGHVLGEEEGGAIVVSPRLIGSPQARQQAVIEHELGNALGVPEQPCGARSVMSRCLDGYLRP